VRWAQSAWDAALRGHLAKAQARARAKTKAKAKLANK
jgi:DNA transformation protein